MSKKKLLEYQLSYGRYGTRIGLKNFQATEYILLAYYNEDIVLRVSENKPRTIAIDITEREYDIMFREMSMKTKIIRDKHSIINFYLWADAVEIAIFKFNSEEHTEENKNMPPNIVRITDEAIGEVKEKYGNTMEKLSG